MFLFSWLLKLLNTTISSGHYLVGGEGLDGAILACSLRWGCKSQRAAGAEATGRSPALDVHAGNHEAGSSCRCSPGAQRLIACRHRPGDLGFLTAWLPGPAEFLPGRPVTPGVSAPPWKVFLKFLKISTRCETTKGFLKHYQ